MHMPHALSERDFALLAVNEVAYVKADVVEGKKVFAIHAADGTQIGMSEDREEAFAAILQQEMQPVSVH